MKFTTFFATLATVAVSASAVPGETNAQRMARGLPPLPPVRRATGLDSARRSLPSQSPPPCGGGPVQCCNSLSDSSDPLVQTLSGLLGIVLGPGGLGVGLGCSPLGIGSSTCSQQTVCCNNNNFNGLIAIGCTPININL